MPRKDWMQCANCKNLCDECGALHCIGYEPEDDDDENKVRQE